MVLSVADDPRVVLSVADVKRNKAPFSSKQTKNAYGRRKMTNSRAAGGQAQDNDGEQLSCMHGADEDDEGPAHSVLCAGARQR